MSEIEVSVVIPVLNAEDTLGEQLQAIARQETAFSFEVVIADNGSLDASRHIVESWRPHLPSLRVVDASDRSGVSHARNVGVSAALGEYVVICDADDVVYPEWIEILTEGLRSADLVGGGFDEVSLNDPISVAWRGTRRGALSEALEFLPYAVGSNIGFRRSVFESIGGWNESYVAGGDDIDFSWRAQLNGFKIAFVPEALVAYRHRSNLRSLRQQFYRYGKAGPRLYAEYRSRGAKRRTIGRALRSWLWLVFRSVDLFRGPVKRGQYLRAASQLVGRVVGSIEHRVLYL